MLLFVLILSLASHHSDAVQGSGNQDTGGIIGTVLGADVYRQQVQQGNNQPLSSELYRLFLYPVMNAYHTAHQQELTPTSQEIDTVNAYFIRKHQETIGPNLAEMQRHLDDLTRKLEQAGLPEDDRAELEIQRDMLAGQMQPPGRQYVEWLLGSWKFQRHLYQNYGGGKLLWQQSGLEAFDATYQWLTQQEQAGQFTMTDQDLRNAFYAYWTTFDHGAFLIDDQARIDQEFLYPEWAQEILR